MTTVTGLPLAWSLAYFVDDKFDTSLVSEKVGKRFLAIINADDQYILWLSVIATHQLCAKATICNGSNCKMSGFMKTNWQNKWKLIATLHIDSKLLLFPIHDETRSQFQLTTLAQYRLLRTTNQDASTGKFQFHLSPIRKWKYKRCDGKSVLFRCLVLIEELYGAQKERIGDESFNSQHLSCRWFQFHRDE